MIMVNILSRLLLITLFTTTLYASENSNLNLDSCLDNTLTTMEINNCYITYNRNLKKELSNLIQKINTIYKDDTKFLKQLKYSQTLWEKQLIEDIKLRYNTEENYSIAATCISSFENKLIKKRIEFLSLWVNGVQEGDVCSGSVRIVGGNNE